ncbi:MAG TPA: phage tail protein [Burkholderiaceae bacterium]|nr:phage tail protein [Burkholderiaceae bacterium]
MKASSASNRRERTAGVAAAAGAVEQPFTNLRFRVAIHGVASPGAVEVVFPTGRIVAAPRGRRQVQFDALVIRRGLTRSADWYAWWRQARRSGRGQQRDVQIVLLDGDGAVALRWVFAGAVPVSYSLSPLNALAGAALIESLELQVSDFQLDQAG